MQQRGVGGADCSIALAHANSSVGSHAADAAVGAWAIAIAASRVKNKKRADVFILKLKDT